jgi:hypothetical protein
MSPVSAISGEGCEGLELETPNLGPQLGTQCCLCDQAGIRCQAFTCLVTNIGTSIGVHCKVLSAVTSSKCSVVGAESEWKVLSRLLSVSFSMIMSQFIGPLSKACHRRVDKPPSLDVVGDLVSPDLATGGHRYRDRSNLIRVHEPERKVNMNDIWGLQPDYR